MVNAQMSEKGAKLVCFKLLQLVLSLVFFCGAPINVMSAATVLDNAEHTECYFCEQFTPNQRAQIICTCGSGASAVSVPSGHLVDRISYYHT